MVVYFSGTGNSRYCAQMLANRLEDALLDAYSYMRNEIAADLRSGKPWVFVCPTYAWRLPRIFETFLQSGTFEGADDAYFVMTCGGEIGNAAPYVEKLCRKIGKRCMGVREVVMPENYLAMFPVPGERESREIRLLAKPVLEETARAIEAGEPLPPEPVDLKGRIKSGVVNHLFYPLIVKDKQFYATDACISCGKCAEACVMENITLENGRPQWHGSCTHCMACITVCPRQAIEYGKVSLGKPRYRCPQWQENDV